MIAESTRTELDRFAKLHAREIECSLRDGLAHLRQPDNLKVIEELGYDTRLIDPENALLSEMPLCLALSFGIAELFKNQGFNLRAGYVFFETPQGWESAGHFFLEDQQGVVICFTAPQFIELNRPPLWRGYKLDALTRRGAGLVYSLSDEVAMLRGERDEIRRQLELVYGHYE